MKVLAIAAILVLAVSLLAPHWIKKFLLRIGCVDVPNLRSSHSHVTLRGGGLCPLLAVLAGYAVLLAVPWAGKGRQILVTILLVAIAAATLGWIEDLRGVPVRLRAAGQMLVAGAGAAALVLISGAPWWLAPLLALAVAGYINVVNFMDGVDGISGLHGTVVGIGFIAVGLDAGLDWLVASGLVTCVAFAGFLLPNLSRDGIFLGDVGSYLLGAMIAITGAAAIANGVSPVAVLGPLAIYLADTATTLLRRILRGERWLEPHRTHCYQRLTDHGWSHVQVAVVTATASGLTAGLGMLSALGTPTASLLAVGGIACVSGLYLALPFFAAAVRSKRLQSPPARRALHL